MHVLATELATLEEADVAIDLGQSPAEIVVLSFSDSDLSALAAAWQQDADLLPTMRLASLKRLRHPMSVDLYVETVVARARIVVVRCLGGLDYWRYGFEHIADVAQNLVLRGALSQALAHLLHGARVAILALDQDCLQIGEHIDHLPSPISAFSRGAWAEHSARASRLNQFAFCGVI